MTAKQICKVTAFLLIGLLVFFPLQEIFLPDWNVDNAEKTLSGFSSLEENTLDVIFLGPSHVGKGIAPMKIYEDTGIRSYNLGTSGQSVITSYFLLNHAFRTQKPEAVFLDVSSFFDRDIHDKRISGFYRYVMDNLYLTQTGLEMAMAYDQIAGNAGTLSALLPMTQFHNRWKELDEADFTPKKTRPYYSMGLCMMSYTAPIDEEVQAVYDTHISQIKAPDSGYYPRISAQAQEYLEKILQLCDENGSALILMKVPSLRSPYDSGWNEIKSGVVSGLAREKQLQFLDFGTMDICDPTTDTSDGKHLNIRGAEKISAWIGAFLALRGVEPENWPEESFDSALDVYRDVREVAMLQSETDFLEYLNRLEQGKDRWSVAIASYGDFVSGLTAEEMQVLKKLGLEKIGRAVNGNTYAAVISEGETRFEELSHRYIDYMESGNGRYLTVRSASKLDATVEGNVTSIAYNDHSAQAGEGLLFLVWDNATGLPIDNKSFDTGTAEKPSYSVSGVVTGYLRQYESAAANGLH